MPAQHHRNEIRVKALIISLLTIFLWAGTQAWGSDLAKERRWAEQLEGTLLVGEAIQLTAGDVSFLGIYAPAVGKVRGGVVLLHGMGAHPDWPDVISPLRQELPEAGWATLSIQLPVRPNDAEPAEYLEMFPEAYPRITAAIDYLGQQGILNTVIVAHSLGAAMGSRFLAEAQPGADKIKAFVGIGMGGQPGTVADTPEALSKIKLPVLDLYGSQDLESVLNTAEARKAALAQNGFPASRQQRVEGADHFFRGLDDSLVKIVGNWLNRHAAGQQLRLDNKPAN